MLDDLSKVLLLAFPTIKCLLKVRVFSKNDFMFSNESKVNS